MNFGLRHAVDIARGFIDDILFDGAIAVDATCGNGQDTLFLAKGVGQTGKVFAFDIQEAALEKTKKILAADGFEERAALIGMGHQYIDKVITGQVNAVMFNLGYLPGGNHAITTNKETTKISLLTALKLLAVKGRLTVVGYTGHPGGIEEVCAVEDVLKALDVSQYNVAKMSFINCKQAPVVFLVEKDGGRTENSTAEANT